jgi:hypothetical protein
MNNEFNSSYSNTPDQSESEPIVVNTVDDSDNSQDVSDFNNIPEPKKNKSGLKAFAVIALAVVLALSAGFGGALIANRIFDNNDNNIIKNLKRYIYLTQKTF